MLYKINFLTTKKILFYLLIVILPFFPRFLFLHIQKGELLEKDWTCYAKTQDKILENVSLPFAWALFGVQENLVSCERKIFLTKENIQEDYGLFLVNVVIAYKVFWNNNLIEQRGSLQKDIRFDPSPNLILIPSKELKVGENSLEILVYDPNGAGGIFRIPIFGKYKFLQKEAFANFLRIGGLIFLCLFLFLFYLFYYFQNPSQKEFFYFAFVCFFVGINISGYYKVSYYFHSSFNLNYFLFNFSLGSFSLGLLFFFNAIFEEKFTLFSNFLLFTFVGYIALSILGGFVPIVRDFQRTYILPAFIITAPVFLSIELISKLIKSQNTTAYGIDYLIIGSLTSILTLNHSYLRFFIPSLPKEELTIESFLTFTIGMILSISEKQKYIQDKLAKIEKSYSDDLKREIKQKTDELQTSNEKLQKEHEFKNKLFSILAHDLRTPLNSLEMLMEIVQEKEISQEEFQKFSKEISLSLRNNQFILNTLLYWISNQIQKREVHLEVFNPTEIIEETIQTLLPQSSQKQIEIEKIYEGTCYVKSDKNMIRIILRNLLSNALKFSHVKSKVIIGYKIIEKECEIFVQDFGFGMSEITQSEILNTKLIEMKPQKGTQNEKGLGLGLKLSSDFLRELGAEIFLASQERKGSKFWFRIPIEKYDTHS